MKLKSTLSKATEVTLLIDSYL